MTARFLDLTFTPLVKAAQEAHGSRDAYARLAESDGAADRLTERETAFIAARDSFYMATVSETGWPYIQHRGGPPGFVKVIDEGRLALADFRGNRQYQSVGNLASDNRVALFFMDYPRRARLKLLGRARMIDLSEAPDLRAALVDPGYRAQAERGLLIDVEAYDWNCPQHITPRHTMAEIEPMIAALKARIAELEAQMSG
ncbi:MAG: pyridoxamine 5-phosphate oxidase [Alphaproteobacteria bacterium RIFCSPHIGHO2_12_FULL_63_12]|nr:MAG: pyridoxamine 5-phosphate oxidase [Alphaproteobacteria bacterium RIFCSPHIGHO2_12_FULL_63_12]